MRKGLVFLILLICANSQLVQDFTKQEVTDFRSSQFSSLKGIPSFSIQKFQTQNSQQVVENRTKQLSPKSNEKEQNNSKQSDSTNIYQNDRQKSLQDRLLSVLVEKQRLDLILYFDQIKQKIRQQIINRISQNNILTMSNLININGKYSNINKNKYMRRNFDKQYAYYQRYFLKRFEECLKLDIDCFQQSPQNIRVAGQQQNLRRVKMNKS